MALTPREQLQIAEACEKTSLEIGRVPSVEDGLTVREQNIFRKHLGMPQIADTEPTRKIADVSDDVEREFERRRAQPAPIGDSNG